jgi:uncharacterized membrane protein YsdA (DUF1294 family)
VTPLAVGLAVLAGWNVATWATYRIDKARARQARRARRIPERVLLAMAAAGGSLGALIAVYAHRQRHKNQKLGFMAWLWAFTLLQLGLVILLLRA